MGARVSLLPFVSLGLIFTIETLAVYHCLQPHQHQHYEISDTTS